MTKEEAYDSLINPLMAQIIAICKEHRIPVLASFTLDAESGLHCTTTLLEDEWEPSEEIIAASKELFRESGASLMTLTTKNERGETTAIETIVYQP